MLESCPNCISSAWSSGLRSPVVRTGRFYRTSDSRWIQRFICKGCFKTFSRATTHPCFRQKKRQLNESLKKLLVSGVSQRRAAKILHLSRTTVVRKFLFLAGQARLEMTQFNLKQEPSSQIQFDDLETMEHSKMKPLSVTLAVEFQSRRILGLRVARMPARGLLAKRARKKYGFRKDERALARQALFQDLKLLVTSACEISSDENPHYPMDVKRFFPNARHIVHKGQRGSVVGQGELKKIRFDPLFSLNHTCAMLRANINRLFRKTWCTTKKPDRLEAHIYLYANYHNQELISLLSLAEKAAAAG